MIKIYGVITNAVGAEFFDGGYETFSDAVDAMVNKWDNIHVQERVTIAKRGYCNESGSDYMIAVGLYDEETGESEDALSLAEAIEAMEEEEEEEE